MDVSVTSFSLTDEDKKLHIGEARSWEKPESPTATWSRASQAVTQGGPRKSVTVLLSADAFLICDKSLHFALIETRRTQGTSCGIIVRIRAERDAWLVVSRHDSLY